MRQPKPITQVDAFCRLHAEVQGAPSGTAFFPAAGVELSAADFDMVAIATPAAEKISRVLGTRVSATKQRH